MTTISERVKSLLGCIFASSADPNIPATPSAGTSYRDESYNASAVASGWPYYNVVNSANFNQIMYLITGLLNEVEKQGILPWSSNTAYPIGAICRDGDDESFYIATAISGPGNAAQRPSTTTGFWKLVDFSNGASWMNADGSNAIPLTISSGTVSGFDCIVGMGLITSGSNRFWYRKWASGWLEQGGFMEKVGNVDDGYQTVTFPLSFLNTDYYVYMGNYRGSTGGSVYRNYQNAASPSVSGIDICVRGDTHSYKGAQNWLAIGRWK